MKRKAVYLTFDLGNTRCKVGLFDAQGTLHRHWVRKRLGRKWLSKQLKRYDIQACILSSVRRGMGKLRRFLEAECPYFLYLSHQVSVPVDNRYATPETLGRDRLAAVCAAQALHPGQACLVLNAGTCLTYDYLDGAGIYRGGSIAPGLRMRFQALASFTARLPLVEPVEDAPPAWGDSTLTALQSGVQQGMCHEIQGFINYYRSKMPNLQVLISGGDGPLLAKGLAETIQQEPHLVLLGLFQILIYNVQRSDA